MFYVSILILYFPPFLVAIWHTNENYFTIQFIFVIIYKFNDIFFVLFMGPTVLFQLTFTFIYSTFNNKFSILTK